MDSLMRPCPILAGALDGPETPVVGGRSVSVGAGRIVVVAGQDNVRAVIEAVLGDSAVSRVSKSDPRIDIVVHRDGSQPDRRVVFVCNPTAEAINAQVGIGAGVDSAVDLWNGGVLAVNDGELALELDPHSITIADLTVRA